MKSLLSLLSCLIMLVGCQTSPKATAYLALSDVAKSVDSAMRLYGKACASGKVSPAQQEKVDAIHERYRLALGSAVRLARHDWQAPVPESVRLVLSELMASLQQLNL